MECSKQKQAHASCLMNCGYQLLIQNAHSDTHDSNHCEVCYLCMKQDVAYPEFFNPEFTKMVERIHSWTTGNYSDIVVGEQVFQYDIVHYFKKYQSISMNFIDQIILQKTFDIFR